MAKYAGSEQVKAGYYWCPRKWEVHVIPPEGGRLPGAATSHYVKVPFPLLFVVVPLMGALFLMFLPLIGFGLLAYAIARKVGLFAKRGAEDLASTMTPGWQPGEAHFTGKPGEEKPGEAKATPGIEKLEKEIAEKKDAKK
jgi:hypothetical protein